MATFGECRGSAKRRSIGNRTDLVVWMKGSRYMNISVSELESCVPEVRRIHENNIVLQAYDGEIDFQVPYTLRYEDYEESVNREFL